MSNMNDFWHYPKSKEDKAEYKRIRREWKKLQQQQYSNSSETRSFKKGSKIILVVCLCVMLVFAAWVFNNGSALKLDRFLENEIVIPEFGTFFKGGKKVSYMTNSYLEQGTMCTLKWNDLVSILNNSIEDFSVYSDEIDLLLKEIELLNKKSISQYDDLKSYEDISKAYCGCIYSFFSLAKKQQCVSIDGYNRFVDELNSLENPYNHLIELFDEYGYYYYIDADKIVHYKVNDSLF